MNRFFFTLRQFFFTPVARLIATGLGIGYLPKAPGTWGSMLAAISAWPIAQQSGGRLVLLSAVILAAGVGTWATWIYIDNTGVHDPEVVVIDEVAGQWLTLVFCPLNPLYWGIAFIVFRFIDIAKIFPANWIDYNMRGPIGVILDDLVAGAYTGLVVWLCFF
ncbi:phosphatidylglycerophosphatase A [Candidatus Endolissoclinum faulkneri L5]|uniref:Phosphatidylglycerophosphatase A n=1 Tax=Candidatus Endolissoclinum faulkneri L5 TaxID=1401328 RepID=V9TX91_9PROT|nr:phosphatidylglycerophosphatase A [Candidatus Endolissoclinum faulkneri]AHC73950.1 phosphatidylglycerophosphatase A [Candidatus Endolissoclinum faulkneri L5]